MNSVDWWARHWRRNPEIAVERCEAVLQGWESWVRYHELMSERGMGGEPAASEHKTLLADQGRYMGFVRMAGRRA